MSDGLPDDLQAVWDRAFAEPGEAQPVGRIVVCDVCSEDWTERPEGGGFLFGSYGYCPDCAPEGLRTIRKYNEERYIKARCEEGESFADFIRRIRGPDAFIRVTKAAVDDGLTPRQAIEDWLDAALREGIDPL